MSDGYYISMKTATLTETKNRLSALIARVRRGETILILDRGRPVAKLAPVPNDATDAGSRLNALERAGILKRGNQKRDVALAKDPPSARKGASILRALLESRREDR
jgi:prevent-host-death family protein